MAEEILSGTNLITAMNCEQADRYIYLYHELSDRERDALELHLSSCEKCREALHVVQQNRVFLQQALTPSTPDNDALTDRIMNEVAKSNRSRTWNRRTIASWVYTQPLRIAFATASFALIAAFLVEFNQPSVPAHHKPTLVLRGNSIRLNTSSFYQTLRNDSTITAFSSRSWVECLRACKAHDREVVCDECKTKFPTLLNEL